MRKFPSVRGEPGGRLKACTIRGAGGGREQKEKETNGRCT